VVLAAAQGTAWDVRAITHNTDSIGITGRADVAGPAVDAVEWQVGDGR